MYKAILPALPTILYSFHLGVELLAGRSWNPFDIFLTSASIISETGIHVASNSTVFVSGGVSEILSNLYPLYLRKHAYSNILKILPQKKKKNENFQIKILIFFIFLLKT